MKTITCIGHITRDHIVTPTSDVSMPGGTTYYFSYGINALLKSSPRSAASVSYRLVASLAESDMKSVDDMRAEGIDVTVVPSRETVFFENIYGADSNNRRQQVLAKADPFTLSSIRDIKADYIVLGSLLADDFPLMSCAICMGAAQWCSMPRGISARCVAQVLSPARGVARMISSVILTS